MLNHRSARILFLILLLGLVFISFSIGLAKYWYIILILAYLSLLVYGSSVIGANYFVRSFTHGDRRSNSIAITFDDGPVPGYTSEVLDILKTQKVQASFFVIGKNIAGNESLIKRINDEGHLLGNHSYEHNFWFSIKNAEEMAADIKKCSGEIARVTGKSTVIFRPPYGVTNPRVAEALIITGLQSVGWSLRTYDTTAKNGSKLLRKTMGKLKGGDIVLFHDWGKFTVPILNEFIALVRKEGFEIIRLDDLLRLKKSN